MKSSNIGLCLVAVAGASVAIYGMTRPSLADSDKGSRHKFAPAVLASVETLEKQLQRRFHDRNNIDFGYNRMVRQGARDHSSVTMDKIGTVRMLADDGHEAKYVQKGDQWYVEIAPGTLVKTQDIKQTMRPENDDEKTAIGQLRTSGNEVALYTMGIFTKDASEPKRLKGPAYLRLTAPDAPKAEDITATATAFWKGKEDHARIDKGEWAYFLSRVRVDDKSCLNCHNGQNRRNTPEGIEWQTATKVGDPVGIFVVGLKANG